MEEKNKSGIRNSAGTWENVYIFISSTFNDMHAERDYLVKKVFPELSVWCAERRLRLIDIDLRWGVTEEDSEKNKRVVDVCLSNIDKCRPLFLCFLGQRRGWVPETRDISSPTFDSFPKLNKYIGSSVTEMEVIHALIDPMLNGSVLELKNAERAFFFMRDASYLENITDRDIRNIYTNEGEEDPGFADRKLEEFKDTIKKIAERPVYTYAAEWDKEAKTPELISSGKPESLGRGRLTRFQCGDRELSTAVIEELKNAITELYPGREKPVLRTMLSKEREEQFQFLQNATEGFMEREGCFDEIFSYINNEDHRPCAVAADAGTGKTSFLAALTEKLESDAEIKVIYRFTGTSENSVSLGKMLPMVVREIGARFGIQDLPSDVQKIKNTLADILEKAALATGKKIVLIIDAVNQLESGLRDLTWVPAYLPDNVKLIYSFKSDDVEGAELYKQLADSKQDSMERGGTCLVTLRPFEKEDDRKALITQYLSQYLKELDEDKIHQIIHSEGTENPLFLKVLLSELKVFGSHEGIADMISGRFGSTPKSAFSGVLKRLEQDPGYSKVPGKALVCNVFGWLSHSKNGLEVIELAELLVQNKIAENMEDAQDGVNLLLRQIRPFLAKRDTKNDFFYESFMLAAKERYTGSAEGSKKDAEWHKDILKLFAQRGTANKRRLYELAYQAAHAGQSERLISLLTNCNHLENKTNVYSISDVIEDFELIHLPEAHISENDRQQLMLIRDAIIMGTPLINIRSRQLAIQLYARLQGYDMPLINKLLTNISDYLKRINRPWMRPLFSFLKQPGGNLIREYEGSQGLALSADGKRMLVDNPADKSIKLVEIKSGKVLRNYASWKVGTKEMLLFEDYHVFALRDYLSLAIVDLETGEQTRIPEINGISSSVFYSYDKYLVLLNYPRNGGTENIFIVDVEKKTIVKTIPVINKSSGGSSYIATFDHETGYLYLVRDGNRMEVMDSKNNFTMVNSFALPNTPPGEPFALRSYTLIPKGENYLIMKPGSPDIKVRDKSSGEVLWDLGRVGQSSEPIAVSSDHRLLACGYFGMVKIYSLTKQEALYILPDDAYKPSPNLITSLLFTDSDKKLLVGKNEGQIELWDLESRTLVRTFTENKALIISMALAERNHLVVSHNRGAAVFDIQKNNLLDTDKEPGPEEARPKEPDFRNISVSDFALAPNDRFLIVVSQSNHVYRVDIPSMKCRELVNNERDYHTYDKPIINADSKYFAVRHKLNTLIFFDCQTGERIAEMPAAHVQKRFAERKDPKDLYQILDPIFLPAEYCMGERNLTVCYKQARFIVLQDIDAPEKIGSVLPFKDHDPHSISIVEGRLLVNSGKEESKYELENAVEPLTDDSAVLLSLPELTCIKHTADFKELYLECMKIDNCQPIKNITSMEEINDYVDLILQRPNLTLYRQKDATDGSRTPRTYTIRNGADGKEITTYVNSLGFGQRRFTKDGKYLFLKEEFSLAAFALENYLEETDA